MTAVSRPIPHNLPIAVSSFIGRGREISEVRQLLPANRLLTLTGPGGCGKTRLALRVADELVSEFDDGVWLTELSALADGALVPQAIASTLGLPEQSGRALLDTLFDHLQPRRLLLLIDNCEHVVEGCARLTQALLQNCRGLRILATSREPLSVPGEAIWIVPPLSLPEPRPWRDPVSGRDALPFYERSEAVRLFVARATAASADFALTAENAGWVVEICRRLDGMPLAIELAAARVRALSVQQIAERLDDRFQLLTAGSRTAPPRHQTLEAAIDWSYALLPQKEQKTLQRLAVFASGCTLEAAEAVCAGEGIEARGVLDALSQLADKSLVVVDQRRHETRYGLLETIRQYAREKLVEAGGADSVKDRHLAHFVRWAEAAEPHVDGPEQLGWLQRFEAEHDNLRAALEHAQAGDGRATAGLRLAAACGRFWRLRGHFSEGRRRLTAALSQPGAQPRTAERARALNFAANLAYVQSDFPATRPLCEESLSINRELGPAGRLGVANALDVLGELATEEGDYTTAPVLFREALAIFRESGDARGIAAMHLQLGWAAMRTGAYDEAAAELEQSLALLRELGDNVGIGLALSGLGEVAVRQAQYERATRLLEESLAIRREIGEKWGIGTSLGSLGWVALRQRDFKRMRAALAESVAVRLEIGDRSGIAWCLEKLAEAAIVQGQATATSVQLERFQTAARIFGAAADLRAPLRAVIDPADQPAYERHRAALRTALGEPAFAEAWAEGEAMALEEAVDYALAEPEPPTSEQAAKEQYGGLTPREREAAALIAQGKTNREIAQAMTVREKTVETYVTRILNKLGFDSRVQIAVWAKERGLA